MARYYFHLTDGNQVLSNHQGVDLPGEAAAREDAMALARDLKGGAIMRGWDWTGWFVAIVNEWPQDRRGADRGCLKLHLPCYQR